MPPPPSDLCTRRFAMRIRGFISSRSRYSRILSASAVPNCAATRARITTPTGTMECSDELHSEDHRTLSQCLVAEKSHIGATARGTERHHVVWLRIGSLHAGRANRHSGNRKPRSIWLFRQETLESSRGNVSFDQVACDLRRMAGCQIRRHAKPRLHRVQICRLDRLDGETGFLQ